MKRLEYFPTGSIPINEERDPSQKNLSPTRFTYLCGIGVFRNLVPEIRINRSPKQGEPLVVIEAETWEGVRNIAERYRLSKPKVKDLPTRS